MMRSRSSLGWAEPASSEPDSRARAEISRVPSSQPAFSVPDKLLHTPTGWTSVPEAYQLPATSHLGLPQLPFPQFLPIIFHGGHQSFCQCGYPGCGGDQQCPQCCQESIPYLSRAQLEIREPISPRSTLPPTISNVGPPGRVNPCERSLVRHLPSQPPSATMRPVLSPARGVAAPHNWTPLSPRPQSTSQKKTLEALTDKKNVMDLHP